MPGFLRAQIFACALAAALPQPALAAQPATLDVKPGQEATFPVTIADGRVTLGPARLGRPGAAQPKDGEIAVSFVRHGLSPYADLTVTEKIASPVDFVATGLIGDIKIDEIVVCGRLDARVAARIGSGAWRVNLNRFAVHSGGAAPAAGEGGLGCM
ncbi:hypothetical protein DFR50_13959 [Roseiarcus fermentans]|uniref:Uncharacterized protein n=1 Tax=Roseiarcus fermentans TaxID=1473586 RepID=A0A366EQ92_9HYPH|nr:hypothetical protein [Roseiarcus fermentans]RBP04582.1 hypothetical protein DFR50_13959 [Roseiarcus fermentans]